MMTAHLQTIAERRHRRYLTWLDDCLDDYPAGIDGPGRRVARRFLNALGNAALLLPDHELDRLLEFLRYLDVTGRPFVPPELVLSLAQLPQASFARLVTRQIAYVLNESGAKFDAIARQWFGGCDFEAQMTDAELWERP